MLRNQDTHAWLHSLWSQTYMAEAEEVQKIVQDHCNRLAKKIEERDRCREVHRFTKRILQVRFKTPKVPVKELSFLKPNQIIICLIFTPPVQEVPVMKAKGPFKVTKVSIPSPPVQQVLLMKATPSFQVTECPIALPPVQKTFNVQGTFPSFISETSVTSPPTQEITSLQVASSTESASLPVSSCPRITSDLSFFWTNPEESRDTEGKEMLKSPE